MKKKSKNNTAYMEGFYDGIEWQKTIQGHNDINYITNAISKVFLKPKKKDKNT